MESGAEVIDRDGDVDALTDLDATEALKVLTDALAQERRAEATRRWIAVGWADRHFGGVDDNTPPRPGRSARTSWLRSLSLSKGKQHHGVPHHDQP